jgi:hypothetical protein
VDGGTRLTEWIRLSELERAEGKKIMRDAERSVIEIGVACMRLV